MNELAFAVARLGPPAPPLRARADRGAPRCRGRAAGRRQRPQRLLRALPARLYEGRQRAARRGQAAVAVANGPPERLGPRAPRPVRLVDGRHGRQHLPVVVHSAGEPFSLAHPASFPG